MEKAHKFPKKNHARFILARQLSTRYTMTFLSPPAHNSTTIPIPKLGTTRQ